MPTRSWPRRSGADPPVPFRGARPGDPRASAVKDASEPFIGELEAGGALTFPSDVGDHRTDRASRAQHTREPALSRTQTGAIAGRGSRISMRDRSVWAQAGGRAPIAGNRSRQRQVRSVGEPRAGTAVRRIARSGHTGQCLLSRARHTGAWRTRSEGSRRAFSDAWYRTRRCLTASAAAQIRVPRGLSRRASCWTGVPNGSVDVERRRRRGFARRSEWPGRVSV